MTYFNIDIYLINFFKLLVSILEISVDEYIKQHILEIWARANLTKSVWKSANLPKNTCLSF